MGRKPYPGGVVRMSFSFTRSGAALIRTEAERRGVPRTHWVEMAARHYHKTIARGGWYCRYTPDAHSYGPSCGHLNSATAPVCYWCGQDAPQIRRAADKAKADAVLAERGTGIPIKELLD